MDDKEFQETLQNALKNGNTEKVIDLIKDFISQNEINEDCAVSIKNIIKTIGRGLSGLKIDGYQGDFPTFIEPVSLIPGVKIGDTVLLGPNVLIGKDCQLGGFCELVNTVLLDKVTLGKLCKLNSCIINGNVTLPEKFHAKDCFITINENGEIETLNI